DLHVLLRIETKPSNGHPCDEIRARPELANPDSLSFEIFGALDRRMRHQDVVQTVADCADKLKLLGALRPCSHYGRSPLQLKRQITGERRLNTHQSPADVYRLELQAVLFGRARTGPDAEEDGRTDHRIADF